jgi:hypothetical protein
MTERTSLTARLPTNPRWRAATAIQADVAWQAATFAAVRSRADTGLLTAKLCTARIGERFLTGPLATHLIGVAGRTARTAVIRVLQEIFGRQTCSIATYFGWGARDSAFPAVAFIAFESLCRINAAGAACFLPGWAGTDSLYTRTGRVTARSLVVAHLAREGAFTKADHRLREEMPGWAGTRAVDADSVRFEATIKVTGA